MSQRIASLRRLREATSLPVTKLDALLAECGGNEAAVLADPRACTKNTAEPFLWCKLGRGVGQDHRGALYHLGCPEVHGERR